jgi:hypothetical protein
MNKIILTFGLIVGTLAINGCSNVQDFVNEVQAKKQQERLDTAKVACRQYGFNEGTDNFSACIQNEVNQIKNREAIAEADQSKSYLPNTNTNTTCRKSIIPGQVDCTSW